MLEINGPFLNFFELRYASEKCKVFIMKIRFHSDANKTNFHMKSFSLSLAFIRFTATRKCPFNACLILRLKLPIFENLIFPRNLLFSL